MPRASSKNKQLFALPEPPPELVQIAGATYRLVRVFKHDFFAATCLYEAVSQQVGDGGNAADASPRFPKIVLKFGRAQWFCCLPTAWYAEILQHHEEDIYRTLAGVPGVPKWVGKFGQTGYAIEYIDALPLDHFQSPPPGFFDRLRKVFDNIHARGIAYVDGNKRSNILITPEGEPYLIDYQISFRDGGLPWPIGAIVRAMVRYFQDKDIYHLYKHKRRMAKDELTPEEEALSRKRGLLHRIHRSLGKPYRAIRRKFLSERFNSGQLVSPTEHLENHHQPEKATWRKV